MGYRLATEKDHVEIGRLMVEVANRHQGIASGLIQKAEAYSGGRVFELYTCSKSYTNIRLYEELGYRIYKEEKGPEELSFVYMRKTI